jgi:hypothetical protein
MPRCSVSFLRPSLCVPKAVSDRLRSKLKTPAKRLFVMSVFTLFCYMLTIRLHHKHTPASESRALFIDILSNFLPPSYVVAMKEAGIHEMDSRPIRDCSPGQAIETMDAYRIAAQIVSLASQGVDFIQSVSITLLRPDGGLNSRPVCPALQHGGSEPALDELRCSFHGCLYNQTDNRRTSSKRFFVLRSMLFGLEQLWSSSRRCLAGCGA